MVIAEIIAMTIDSKIRFIFTVSVRFVLSIERTGFPNSAVEREGKRVKYTLLGSYPQFVLVVNSL